MEPSELDSFLVKFKYLWHSGLEAKLSVESHAGQAWVVLQAGLGQGHALQPPVPWPHHQRNRNGPAQQRRRTRREAARKVAPKNMSTQTQTEEDPENISEVAEEAPTISENSEQKKENEVKKIAPSILDDEFCADKEYANGEEDILVERIIITPDCQSDWKEAVVKKLVGEKLATIGLNSLGVKVIGSNRARFVSCEVEIEPVKMKVLQDLEFPMRRWKIVIPT